MSGDDEPSSGSGDEVHMVDVHNNKRTPPTPPSGSVPAARKRTRKASGGDAIVEAMLEIAAASKLRAAALTKNGGGGGGGGDRFSISKCIKALDELQGVVDQHTYFLALDLFENPSFREIFMSLRNDKRLKWLQGKCRASQ